MEGKIINPMPTVSVSPRRVPGSGLRTPIARKKLPKQWRHLLVVTLALLVTVIGTSQPLGKPDKGQTIDHALASDVITSELPTLKSISLPPVPVKSPTSPRPNFAANAVVLIDDATKIVLYAKNSDIRRAVASTTKIVTAQVAIEQFTNLDQPTYISKNAINQIGSLVGYRIGETATVRQLIYGLLMASGNDAAVQLSELMPPRGGQAGVAAFVDEMNQLASRLGMENTHFVDPAGLDDLGYSTPADMTKALSGLLQYPELAKIVGMANYVYSSPQQYVHTLKNSNRLVTDEMHYMGIIGGKTGFTPETPDGGAGHCLVVAAMRDGHRLIAAIYGTYSGAPQASAEVARQVLDYGFNNFTWQPWPR